MLGKLEVGRTCRERVATVATVDNQCKEEGGAES